jgi:hypothetical protein
MTNLVYSNPRLNALIENWPSGNRRVAASFSIETHPTRGQRAVRVTTGAPKKLTFARQMRIVDGSDGLTYIAALSAYGHVTIFCGDMKYNKEFVSERDERYPSIRALFAA